MDSLDKLRKKIDKIDDEIIRLLHERRGVVEKIALCKIKRGLPVIDKKRERQMRTMHKKGKFDKYFKKTIANFMTFVFRESKSYQKRLRRRNV